jgi:hypothetical protein
MEELPDAGGLCVRSDGVLEVQHDVLKRGGIGETQWCLGRRRVRAPEQSLWTRLTSSPRALQPNIGCAPVLKEARVVAGVLAAREAHALDAHLLVAEGAEGSRVGDPQRGGSRQQAAQLRGREKLESQRGGERVHVGWRHVLRGLLSVVAVEAVDGVARPVGSDWNSVEVHAEVVGNPLP